MINEQKIPCPICKTQISFNAILLLQGAQFSCQNCQAIVAIAPESVDVTKYARELFEQLKQHSSKIAK